MIQQENNRQTKRQRGNMQLSACNFLLSHTGQRKLVHKSDRGGIRQGAIRHSGKPPPHNSREEQLTTRLVLRII